MSNTVSLLEGTNKQSPEEYVHLLNTLTLFSAKHLRHFRLAQTSSASCCGRGRSLLFAAGARAARSGSAAFERGERRWHWKSLESVGFAVGMSSRGLPAPKGAGGFSEAQGLPVEVAGFFEQFFEIEASRAARDLSEWDDTLYL